MAPVTTLAVIAIFMVIGWYQRRADWRAATPFLPVLPLPKIDMAEEGDGYWIVCVPRGGGWTPGLVGTVEYRQLLPENVRRSFEKKRQKGKATR